MIEAKRKLFSFFSIKAISFVLIVLPMVVLIFFNYQKIDQFWTQTLIYGIAFLMTSGTAVFILWLFARLNAANERLRELDGLKSDFISLVSHEFRNPLTVMSAALDSISDGIVSPIHLPDTLKLLKRQVVRLNTLVNDVLDVSKIEAGKMIYHFKNHNFSLLLSEMLEECSEKAKELGIHLNSKIDPHLPFVRADRDKLIEVLSNLIGNSLKFTPKDGKITIEAGVKKEVFGECVEIRIIDTGCGISKDKIQILFERFGESSSTVTQKGTGLGLYIVKSYIKAHQGNIRVESKENVKTSVIFTLPVAKTPQILVVDDTRDMLALVQEELINKGYDVSTASSGQEVLTMVEQEKIPDLFLMDIHMSPMGGHELIGRLRELKITQHIPIIAMTATDEELDWFKKNNSTIQVVDKTKLLRQLLPLLKEELGEYPLSLSKTKLKKAA